MARTRNTVSKAAHLLRSGRQFDTSGSIATASSGKSKLGTKTTGHLVEKKKNVHSSGHNEIRDFDGAADDELGKGDEDSSEAESDDEDFDVEESEEDSDNYLPTRIMGKKRVIQKTDAKYVNQTPRGLGEKANSKATSNAPSKTAQQAQKSTSTKHDKTSAVSSILSSKAAKSPCVACRNAHLKCSASAVPGQPCQRCAVMRLRCVVDPNHKRDRTSRGDNGRLEKKKTAQESVQDDDVGDTSSDDLINSAVALPQPPRRSTRGVSRNTIGTLTTMVPKAKQSATAKHASKLSSKTYQENELSSSPLSSANEFGEELDITMAGVQNEEEDIGPLVPIPITDGKTRLTRAAKMGTRNDGLTPAPRAEDVNGLQKASSSPPSVHALTPPVDTPFPGQHTSPARATHHAPVVPEQRSGQFPTSTIPHEAPALSQAPPPSQNTPTFLPAGHGSVLNSHDDDHLMPQPQPQPTLPPISQLGQGGAYIGRYDAHLAQHAPRTTSALQQPQPVQALPIAGSSSSSSSHNSRSVQQSRLSATEPNGSSSSNGNNAAATAAPTPSTTDMPAPGTPAYRYSATKILLFLKHGQRAQLLALGGAAIAPDSVAQLTRDMEEVRLRAIALWYEVHDGQAVVVGGGGSGGGGEMYDAGGLAFLEGFGQ